MDLNENGSLITLENLLDEFFNSYTSNVRKHEIETHLNSFKTQPNLWKYCVYYVTRTSSQYVTMFSLSVLESVINQQSSAIEWSTKEQIKNILYEKLMDGGDPSHFLRYKYAKLLVDIAKQDWPQRYPHFFDNILELLKCERNQLVGLILLKTTSEEFAGVRSSIDGERKNEITRLLHSYIPLVFELLMAICENLESKPRHTESTATPPPSPTHPASVPSLFEQQLATATFKTDMCSRSQLTREALLTVQHLFTWVQISMIPARLVKAVFGFTNVFSGNFAQDDLDICILAMSTVNELLYRKCVPPGSQDFFFQLYSFSVELLKDTTKSLAYAADNLDPLFVDKLCELLCLVMEQHLWRLESQPSFSPMDFLSALFQLTMQPNASNAPVADYLRCLSVWAAFVKQIKPQNANKYLEVFLGLTDGLLKKIQFSYNYAQLNQINDVDHDEDEQTSFQIFLTNSIEIIALLAKFTPVEIFNQVLMPWTVCYDVYKHVCRSVDHQNSALNFDSAETERLCYVLRDFSSLTETLARLSSLFIDQDNDEVTKQAAPLINNLIEKLLESALLATSVKFYNLKNGCDSRLSDCFINIHSQLLAALKTWFPWMEQRDQAPVDRHAEAILNITVPILVEGASVPVEIARTAARLLLTFTAAMPAPSLVSAPNFVQFLLLTPDLRFTYGKKHDGSVSQVLYCAVCNFLLKPWGEITPNDLAHKNSLIETFFDKLTRDFRALTQNTSEASALEVTGNVLPAVSSVVEHCKALPMVSKKQLSVILKPTFEHGLALFQSYLNYPEVSGHLLNFFSVILGVLQQQIGVECTKNAVHVLLQTTLSNQQASQSGGLDKLLYIFQLIVESPGTGYKTFLPGILQLCMENIYPTIVSQADDSPDVFLALLSLLYSVLLHRWQYFYASQVRLGYSPGCSESDFGPDVPQKPEQLLAILQVFGHALLKRDINIFKSSLVALQDLNNKWKLYHKALVRAQLLPKFLTVLLTTLIDKTHCLLSDDVYVAIFNMAQVSFDGFLTFLRQFVEILEGKIDPSRWEVLLRNFIHNHDTDMPTFIHQLQKFVAQIQHYRL